MMKKHLIICLIMIFVLSIASTVSANANIIFNPSKVYFADNGKLVVAGALINNGDQNGIVDNAQLKVYRVNDNGQFLLTNANFTNVNAFVPAGGTLKWQFNISGVVYTEIGHWRVIADLGYHS